jgi:hypothetical protein
LDGAAVVDCGGDDDEDEDEDDAAGAGAIWLLLDDDEEEEEAEEEVAGLAPNETALSSALPRSSAAQHHLRDWAAYTWRA